MYKGVVVWIVARVDVFVAEYVVSVGKKNVNRGKFG